MRQSGKLNYTERLNDDFNLKGRKGRTKKLICTLLASGYLVLSGAGMTSYAGVTSQANVTWEEADGGFQCFDQEGDPISDSWVRDGGRLYYIGEDGYMMTDQMVEDGEYTYYVGADGEMVKNRWVTVSNDPGGEDQCEHDVSAIWYYFGSSGRAYADGRKTIGEKKYIFDEEGHMLSGWQTYENDSDIYYLGTEDEGWIHTGWQKLEPWNEMDGDYDTKEWFYFRSNSGKAYRDVKKKINGDYYQFDENGVMEVRWNLTTPSNAVASESNAAPAWYDEDTGKANKGWIHTYDPEDVDKTDSEYWYYLDSEGVPFNRGGKDANSVSYAVDVMSNLYMHNYAAKVIEGETYIFNDKGQMVTGYLSLWNVRRVGGSDLGVSEWENYYFCNLDSKKKGRMMTGKQTIYDDNGNEIGYVHLKDNGQAYTTAIVEGRLYDPTGLLFDDIEGEYDLLYLGNLSFKVKGSSLVLTDCLILVDKSGKLKKSGTVSMDGWRYTVKNYEVIDVVEQ